MNTDGHGCSGLKARQIGGCLPGHLDVKVWRCTIEIVKHTEAHTFKVLQRCWLAECTFSWFGVIGDSTETTNTKPRPAKSLFM